MSWAWRPQAGPQKALVECPLKEIFPAKPRHRGGCRAGVNETLPAVSGREACDAGQPGGNPSVSFGCACGLKESGEASESQSAAARVAHKVSPGVIAGRGALHGCRA